jgi:N-methylhydantoinase A
MRYLGQSYNVSVPFPADRGDLKGLAVAFHREHERAYAHAHPDEDVEVTTLRLSATAPGLGFAFSPRATTTGDVETEERRRSIRFGDKTHEARTLRRASIGHHTIKGPAAIEDTDTTVLIPPHGRATVDDAGFVSVVLTPEPMHG